MRHTEGRIVIRVNLEEKNYHRMENGQVLRLERGWNNLNRLEVSPVNAIVISGKDIPDGAEALIHHNSVHEAYRITNHGELSGQKIADRIEYYSIPEDQIFFWRKDSEVWNPIKGYVTALRVFKPYTGILHGIDHTRIKETLYITSGELTGKIVHTLKASDYCIIFQDLNGREHQIIRVRHWDNEDNDRDEIVAIHEEYTKLIKKGQLLVGLTSSNAKSIRTCSI